MTIKCICGMDDTTVMIKVDFQDMQIIGMMHRVMVKNRASVEFRKSVVRD